MTSSTLDIAKLLSFANGEIQATITINPASVINLAISAIRLTFSILSVIEKPKSLLIPSLKLSASNIDTCFPD
jgi:hypothetical protein